MSRSTLIKEIRELIDENLSEWVDLHPIIIKHCDGLEFHQVQSVRTTIRTILEEMKRNGDITYNDPEMSNALSISTAQRYRSDNLRIRTTMHYDSRKEQERNKPEIPSFTNYGTITGSAIGNIQSDLSSALQSPTTNIINTQNAHPKNKRSFLEIAAWIAAILAVIVSIMMYFKVWPF